ncbi:hypothetical protein FACS189464_3060 [Bacteroidia bacterium]|nr:hypothetical protein FACS189430_00020 [Bacteroidia bacterium]GHT78879.1 hypothetical protein FACS189464_3060 [Bacteroidia bacterium]
MKKIIVYLIIAVFISGCSDYLDIVPDNVATMEHAFKDEISAERFLATLYWRMPLFGRPTRDQAIMASDEFVLTFPLAENLDLYVGDLIKKGQQNTNSPLIDNWTGANQGRGMFQAIRECNIFLENIETVPDMMPEKRSRWIAEAKFLKAFYHFYLMELYGPIPLVKENLPVSTEQEAVQSYRDPFEDGITYVISLLDESIPDLPLSITSVGTELGRVTKPMAVSLKARILVTAASPLFNGNPDYVSVADNRGVKLFSQTHDESKWALAAAACKEAIEICESANISLFEYTDSRYDLSDETRLTMTIRGAATESWNQELIWVFPPTSTTLTTTNLLGLINNNTTAILQGFTMPYLSAAQQSGQKLELKLAPPFEIAEMFYSKNGVPIDEDKTFDYANRYRVTTAGDEQFYYVKPGFRTAGMNLNREPRFYGNLGFDGNYWFGNGRTKDVGKGADTETAWLMRAKRTETSGKMAAVRYSRTGYFCKKGSHYTTEATATNVVVTEFTYPVMRLADLYLLYAEALNESQSAPGADVFEYIDRVRSRAGLKGVAESWASYSNVPQKYATKEGMREIIHRERMIELAFEGKRFYDLRRWKKAHLYYNRNNYGWNIDATDENEYYTPVVIEQLNYPTKLYLWPIAETELRKNKNLVQNPFWNN